MSDNKNKLGWREDKIGDEIDLSDYVSKRVGEYVSTLYGALMKEWDIDPKEFSTDTPPLQEIINKAQDKNPLNNHLREDFARIGDKVLDSLNPSRFPQKIEEPVSSEKSTDDPNVSDPKHTGGRF